MFEKELVLKDHVAVAAVMPAVYDLADSAARKYMNSKIDNKSLEGLKSAASKALDELKPPVPTDMRETVLEQIGENYKSRF